MQFVLKFRVRVTVNVCKLAHAVIQATASDLCNESPPELGLDQHMSKRTTLSPSAGFVVKTTTQKPGIYTPTASTDKQLSPTLLEPTKYSTSISYGFKIFINIAFDRGVPPPPRSSESDIRKAMAGDEDAYFIPVVVSDGREVTDKGKPSVSFSSDIPQTKCI